MQAGTMRHPIAVQRAMSSVDDSGAPQNTWIHAFDGWASIDPSGTNESIVDGGTMAIQSLVLRTRHNPEYAVKAQDRIIFDSRVFEVESVTNIAERDRELVLVCREHAD